jgi:hypothetical protein
MIRDWWLDIKADFDDWWYKVTPEYQQLARRRYAAHCLALKEGRNSPYTHPDEYPLNY